MRIVLTLICALVGIANLSLAQNSKFAVISDLYINKDNDLSLNYLTTNISSINIIPDLDFVLVLGNIAELGDKQSMLLAKESLDQLNTKYYTIPGNLETQQGGTALENYYDIFKDNTLNFEHNGIRYIGLVNTPLVKIKDGSFSREKQLALRKELNKKKDTPTIIITHYPINQSYMENWYDLLDLLKKYNIKCILNGHLRRNLATSSEGIPTFINRSILTNSSNKLTGYNIYTIENNKLTVYEQKIDPYLKPFRWSELYLGKNNYDNETYYRPTYEINNKYLNANLSWSRNLYKEFLSAPYTSSNRAILGDINGNIYAFALNKEEELWKYKVNDAIIGDLDGNSNVVVVPSVDKNIYGINISNGSLKWQISLQHPVVSGVSVFNNIAYIGTSENIFYAIDINTGSVKWEYRDFDGHITSKPFIYNGKVIFYSSDNKLHCLDTTNGALIWKWENNNIDTSPVIINPIAGNDRVFFTTPQKTLVALNFNNGEILWEVNDYQFYESIGVSTDEQYIYTKIKDKVVCYSSKEDINQNESIKPLELWKVNIDFGSDNTDSRLIEKGGTLFGSTKNGEIFAINAKKGNLLWRKKIDNFYIPTVAPINASQCFFVSGDGTIGVMKGK